MTDIPSDPQAAAPDLPDSPATPAMPSLPDAPVPSTTDAVAEVAVAEEAVAVADAAPAAALPVELTPAAVAARLKALFPALFGGNSFKPLKLRVQADIQERAPGQFTKAQLSAFLRRHTGSTGYLIALSKAAHRFDLDGAPAGELSEEHRNAARDELTRRKGLQQERNAAENERLALEQTQARNRAGLLFDYERTTLTLPNFCALKGVSAEELPGLLEIARQEAAARPPAPVFERQERPPRRDNPPNRRPPQTRR
ncbi:hypothetical protein BH11PSE10_BH11PSE10_16800 [soil metagenome]